MVSYENPGLSSASWNGELAFAQTKLLAENSWGGGEERQKYISFKRFNGSKEQNRISRSKISERRGAQESEPDIWCAFFFFPPEILANSGFQVEMLSKSGS